MRFAYATRGDGQVMAPAQKTLGLKAGKKFNLGRGNSVELAANIFNLLNAGDYTQYNYNGANEQFNPNYLGMRNQQPARALQLTTGVPVLSRSNVVSAFRRTGITVRLKPDTTSCPTESGH